MIPAQKEKFVLNPGWQILFNEMGLPVTDTLQKAGLSPSLFDDLPVALDAAGYFRFWRAMEANCGQRELPLALARALDVEVFSPPLYIAVCSHNLRQAAHRVARYKSLTGPITINVMQSTAHLKLTWEWPLHIDPPPALPMSEVLFWAYLARRCTRSAIDPVEVSTPVLPRAMPAYLDFIRAPIRRADDVSITFASRDVDRDFISGNDAVWSAFEPALKEQLAALRTDGAIADRARVVLLRAIPAGTANTDHVAGMLSITPRTLQRRLRDENTSFKAVLNDTRAELAKIYLRRPDLSLSEISFLLGYKEPSSFNRAFREWTKTTPDRFRRENTGQAATGKH